ncbi:MAG: hypothetical protein HY719_16705, partial [Planctomycetes bacterium]|nr:hypothetical protein [Planctomycetota bacterium]
MPVFARAKALVIDEVIARAEALERAANETLPGATRLLETAAALSQAARKVAGRVRRMRSPWSIAWLRLYLLAAGLAAAAWWGYTERFEKRPVRVAVPRSDHALLADRVAASDVARVSLVECAGSAEGIDLLADRRAEMCVVQGGVAIPPIYDVVGVVRREHVLYLVRRPVPPGGRAPVVITFSPNQGSHQLGKRFFRLWGHAEPRWLHVWSDLAGAAPAPIPEEADAVFVVVDPAEPAMARALERVARAGFAFTEPDIGVHAETLPYLHRVEAPPGYFFSGEGARGRTDGGPLLVPEAGRGRMTYAVDNLLVAHRGVKARQREDAARAMGVADAPPEGPPPAFLATAADALDVAIDLIVILAALFGVEMLLYRRYLHELGNLISAITIVQSEKTLLGVRESVQVRAALAWLGYCSDMLNLISALAGIYARANAALVFNGVTGAIQSRATEIKLNIQLKVLQAIVPVPDPPELPDLPPAA